MRTVHRNVIESTTRLYDAVLVDENGARIKGSAVSTLTLTLYNRHDQAIVNSRNASNVLNTAGGTLDESGNFTFEFTPLDTAIIDSALDYENRIALFTIGYATGRQQRHEIELQIRNAVKVP